MTTESKRSSRSTRSYHHGNLRAALLVAAFDLAATRGLDAVSVREVAKVVGVSPSAPFRHFDSRTALLTAMAEEALDLLVLTIEKGMKKAAKGDSLERFRSMGMSFLTWAFTHPIHFQVISSRAVIDFEGSTLRQRNGAIRAAMAGLLEGASRAGLLKSGDIERHLLAARALVYGLARMFTDGQYPSWGLSEARALQESKAILDQFMMSIRVSRHA